MIIILYLRNRNTANKLSLKNAIDTIEDLNSSMESLKGRIEEIDVSPSTETSECIKSPSLISSSDYADEEKTDGTYSFDEECQEKGNEDIQEDHEKSVPMPLYEDFPKKESVDDLKKDLRRQVSMFLENVGPTSVSPIILESDAYKNVVRRLEEGKPLVGKDSIWQDLRECVEKNFPQFKTRLQILIGKKLKPLQYQVAILMKCGFTPNETGILLCKERSTISYYRKFFANSIYNPPIDNNKLEDVMRLL